MSLCTCAPFVLPRSCDKYDTPAFYYNGKLYNSTSRYGFSLSEMESIVGNENCFEITCRDSYPTIVTTTDVHIEQHLSFVVGICAERPVQQSIRRLKSLGFNPVMPDSETGNLRIGSKNFIKHGRSLIPVKYLFVKAADIPEMMGNDIIDAFAAYGDVCYNFDEPDYNIKYLSCFSPCPFGGDNTHISLIGKPCITVENDQIFRNGKPFTGSVKVFSEYKHAERLMGQFVHNELEFTTVRGCAESYLHQDICDIAITIVQSDNTLEQNGLVEVFRLQKVVLNLWLNIPPRVEGKDLKLKHELKVSLYTSLKPDFKAIIIDGIDGTGKTTVLRRLQEDDRNHLTLLFDRHPAIYKATLSEEAELNSSSVYGDVFSAKNTKVIIFEAEPEVCEKRLRLRDGQQTTLERHEEKDAQYFFRLRYRQLAAVHGYYVVPSDEDVETVLDRVNSIIHNSTGDSSYWKVPVLTSMDSFFDGLDFIAEGESKIVRKWNERFDIVKYKPSVYSHKRQRGGTVEGSEVERQKTTLNILILLAQAGVAHTYWHIHNGYILAEHIDPPPVEVCVKAAHVGTHKHIYANMGKAVDRFDMPLVGSFDMYNFAPIVRFDWRNPNHLERAVSQGYATMKHTQIFAHPLREKGWSEAKIEEFFEAMFPNGVPLGDAAMADELADRFINVTNARMLAKTAFGALTKHFKAMNLRFKDVCFMITTDGRRLFGEVSQDCGRYEAIDSSVEAFQSCVSEPVPWNTESTSVDKDIWRAGGSSKMVLDKWQRLTFMVESYTKDFIRRYIKELFE